MYGLLCVAERDIKLIFSKGPASICAPRLLLDRVALAMRTFSGSVKRLPGRLPRKDGNVCPRSGYGQVRPITYLPSASQGGMCLSLLCISKLSTTAPQHGPPANTMGASWEALRMRGKWFV